MQPRTCFKLLQQLFSPSTNGFPVLFQAIRWISIWSRRRAAAKHWQEPVVNKLFQVFSSRMSVSSVNIEIQDSRSPAICQLLIEIVLAGINYPLTRERSTANLPRPICPRGPLHGSHWSLDKRNVQLEHQPPRRFEPVADGVNPVRACDDRNEQAQGPSRVLYSHPEKLVHRSGLASPRRDQFRDLEVLKLGYSANTVPGRPELDVLSECR